jgi:hypothetical protein
MNHLGALPRQGQAVPVVAAANEPPPHPDDQDENDPTFDSLPGDLLPNIFGFLDVKSLCQASQVSRTFKIQSEAAMEAKKKPGAGIFRSKDELATAVNKFWQCKYKKYDQELAEEIARDYGLIMMYLL